MKQGRRIAETYSRWRFSDLIGCEDMEEDSGWNDEEGREVSTCALYAETPWGEAATMLNLEGACMPSSSSWGVGVWYSTEARMEPRSDGWTEERSFHLRGFTRAEEWLTWLQLGHSRAGVRLSGRFRAAVALLRARWAVALWAWDLYDEVRFRARQFFRRLANRCLICGRLRVRGKCSGCGWGGPLRGWAA